jgi:hypothetical protein
MITVLAFVVAAVAAARGMWSPCGLSMLSSLNPVSEQARGHRFWLTACWYVAGAIAGGAALGAGAALAAFGVGRAALGHGAVWGLVLAFALVTGGSDTRVVGRSLPEHPRQVDERWLVKYRRWVYAAGYGFQIGAGFATYIMTAAVYLSVALAVLSGSPLTAFLVCITFGAVRGLTVLVSAFATSPDRLRVTHRRLAALAGPSLAVAVAVQAAAAILAGDELGGALVAGVVAGVTLLAAEWRMLPRALRAVGHIGN